MSETVNQEATNNGTGEEAVKTYTQAELDKVVEGRIFREREKFKDYEAYKE